MLADLIRKYQMFGDCQFCKLKNSGVWSGVEVRKACSFQNILSKNCSLTKVGFDAAENEHGLKILQLYAKFGKRMPVVCLYVSCIHTIYSGPSLQPDLQPCLHHCQMPENIFDALLHLSLSLSEEMRETL